MAENYYKKYNTTFFLYFELCGGTEELLIMCLCVCVIFLIAHYVI